MGINEDDDPFDLGEVFSAQVNMAELLWAYSQALNNAGFNPEHSLALVLAYQTTMLTSGPSLPPSGTH